MCLSVLIKVVFHLQALADPYFCGLANLEHEPSKQPISKLEFDFERRKLTKDDVRELIYREVRLLLICLVGLLFTSCFSASVYSVLMHMS